MRSVCARPVHIVPSLAKHTHTHILYTAFISLSRRGADARSALPFPCTRWPSTGRRTTIYCMRAGPRTLDGAHDGRAPHLYARPERFQFNKCFVSFIKHLFVPWPCDAYASRRRVVTRVWKLNCSGRTEPRTFGQCVKVCVCRVRLDTAYWSMMRVVVEERRTETIRDAELNCALIEMRMQTNGRPICYAINRFDRIQLKRAPHYVWHIPQSVRPHPAGGRHLIATR